MAKPGIDSVARALLGEPDPARSNGERLCYGRFEISTETGRFYDYNADESGDVRALVARVKHVPETEADAWLTQFQAEAPEEGAPREALPDTDPSELAELVDSDPVDSDHVRRFGTRTARAIASIWRDVATAPDKVAGFREAARNLAALTPGWIDRASAAAMAMDIAMAHGLNERLGTDGVQQIIAESFARPEARESGSAGADIGEPPPPAGSEDYGTSGRADAEAPPPRVEPTAWTWRDPRTIPPRQWLYGRHYIRRFVTGTFAPGGIGKSSLSMAEAVAMATGRPLMGVHVPTPLRGWLWNGEEPGEELDRRICAICAHYGVSEPELAGRLFVDSGREKPFLFARQHGGALEINRPLISALAGDVQERGIDLLVVDPFVACHAVPENDNGAIAHVIKSLAEIADKANCGVDLVHHTRKPAAGVSGDITESDGRGASSLVDGIRSARVLNPMTAADATRFGIAEEERRLYFRVDDGKGNMRPPAKATWRKLVPIPLGNGTVQTPEDLVAVVATWTPPDSMEGLTAADLLAVQKRVAEGAWRESAQSPEWVGKAVAEVLDLDLNSAPPQNRIKTLLKIWIESGALKVVERDDEKRKPRKFVEVGQWAI